MEKYAFCFLFTYLDATLFHNRSRDRDGRNGGEYNPQPPSSTSPPDQDQILSIFPLLQAS